MTNALEEGQYALAEITKYESVYGYNFVSPGGLASAQAITALLHLRPGMQVLDVGCGLGGSAFYMASQYGVKVHGVDLSHNMIALAHVRCTEAGLSDRVTFEQGDILTFNPSRHYDCVYSRDAFLHIQDKSRLLRVLMTCLKPGGRLVFTDYTCGEGEKSHSFQAYIQQRGYDLHTVNGYATLLLNSGFTSILAEDCTAQFIVILNSELEHMATQPLSAKSLSELQQSWHDKLQRAQQGEQCWGLFQAERPLQ
jgi:phosphoethanolamine N-methyltransferase